MTADYTQYPYIEKRIRYFDGQFLKDQDFIDEQKYHIDRQRRHQRFLYVSGIVDGLEVTAGSPENPDTPDLVTVAAGTALDRDGRQLVLGSRRQVSLGAVRDRQQTIQVYLVIQYGEVGSDPEQAGGDTYRRWHEVPNLTTVALTNPDNPEASPIPNDAVVLALLTLNAEGVVTVDASVRVYSGLALPGASAFSGRPTLRSGGTRAPDLAVLRGRLSVTGFTGLGTDTPQGRLHIVHEPQDANGNALIMGPADGSNLRLGYHADYAWLQSHGNRPLTINPVGNAVGIGTTAPKSTLAIAGGMAIGNTFASNTPAPNNSLVIEDKIGIGTADLQGNYRLVLQQTTANSGYGLRVLNPDQSRSAQLWVGTGGAVLDAEGSTHLHLRTAGADRLFISNGGNIGIGGNNPLQMLDINGRLHIANGVIQRGGNAITNTSDLGLYSQVSGHWIRIVSTNAPIRFFTDGGIGTTVRMSIESNGNVNINQGLTVSGALSANSISASGIMSANNAAIGPGNLTATGPIYAASSDIYFTQTNHRHTGIGNATGHAAIENSQEYNALMILGRSSYPNNRLKRKVNLYDDVEIAGGLQVRSVPFGDARNMQWNDQSGALQYDNSSRRYKENITDLRDDFAQILRAQPKTYTRPDNPDRWEIGYIAEEFQDLGLDRLLYFDQEGLPDGINYRKISLYLLEVVKDLAQKVQGYEQRLEQLESKDLA
ncbi:tail fiber domain-containing protein [Trichothermofontia sp.]